MALADKGMRRGGREGLWAGLVVLAAWWAAGPLLGVPGWLLPGPVETAATLIFLATNASLAWHVGLTLGEIAAGFVIGGAVGIATGWLFTRLPWLERLLWPLILLVQTAPKIALAPLFVLWLGLGMAPKVVLIAIVSFFPAMAGTQSGLRTVERSWHDLATILRMPAWRRFARVELPLALPEILAGLRIASTHAVTAAVIGELIGATGGLGYLLSVGQENADAKVTMAAILLLCALGWALHELVRRVELAVGSWRRAGTGLDPAG